MNPSTGPTSEKTLLDFASALQTCCKNLGIDCPENLHLTKEGVQDFVDLLRRNAQIEEEERQIDAWEAAGAPERDYGSGRI